MTLLIAGLALFLGIHLVPALPPLRARLAGALGDTRYRGAFTAVSLVGVVLIVLGYRAADPAPRLFAPFVGAIHAAPLVVPIALILFAAANRRGHLRRVLKHPMLIGLILWSGVHLLANGDLRGTVLFGAFLAYAVVDLLSAIARGATKPFEPTGRHDAMAIVGGLVLALVIMLSHRLLFGVRVVPFGF